MRSRATPGPDHDAVLLACFGDPGLDALRELSPKPVVGMADASFMAAAQIGRRIGVVSGGDRWRPMMREFVEARGLSSRFAGIRTIAPSGGDIARDPDRFLGVLADACNALVREDGADVVILGGAGLAGLSDPLQPKVDCPLIDNVVAAIAQTEAQVKLATMDRPKSRAGLGVKTQGLSAELTRAIAQLS
jgi:allantoin racemase